MIDIQCPHSDQPTSKADDTIDTMKPLVQATHVSNTALQKGQSKLDRRSESEATDCPDPRQPGIRTKFPDADEIMRVIRILEQVESEDMMQSIRSQVLRAWEAQQSTKLGLTLSIRCNLREFMEKQFAGSNRSLGRVITINGTATCGHATTCSDYISSNWPLRGLWLLNILQDTFDRAKSNVEGNWPL